MNFIDTNHSYGRWPWTQAGSTSAAELQDRLAAEGIAEAWVASTDALLAEDIGLAEERMFRELAGVDNIRLVRTLNPAQSGSVAMYRAALSDPRCVAVRLAPGLHHYHLFDECVSALGEVMQAEGDLPVQILYRFDDIRHRLPALVTKEPQPLDVVCLVQRFPRLRFLVQGATNGEASQMAGRHHVHRDKENIWIDTSFLDQMDVLAKVTRDIPADRLVFGTAEPFLYARANVLLFASPTLPVADQAMIARDNAVALSR
jgi:hypothetical protein